MNPFSHYAKPFTTQPITGFQPIRNPIHHPIPRNDNPNASPPFNSLGFQPTHHSDQNIAQRCPPPQDPYPNKRVRHSQESYTEVFQEGSTPVNQVRNAVKLEEQRQAQASVKGLDQGFTSMSPGFRKTQNNYSFGMQENSGWNNSIYHNAMNMMLLRQHFSRTRKDALSRESPQSPSQPNFQNDGGYSTAGNNVNIASLLQNNMNITSPHGADLIRQIDAYNMMLLYQQQLVQQQLLYNLQDPSGKGNLNLKNANNEPSSPLMRIPPLVGQNFLEYMSGSPLAVNNINALLRSEIRDKTILNDANLEELQKLSLNQAVEALSRTSKAVETGGQEDQKENRPPDSKFVVNDGKMKQENVCSNIVLQSSEDNRLSTAAESPSERLKNQKRKTSLTQKVGTVSETKRDSGLRRKNKWQMMIDTNEECSSEGSPEVNSSNKAGMSTKSDQSTKPNLRGSSAFRKLSIPANRVQDEFQDKTRTKKTRYESSSHRKKKAMKAAAKIKAEAESLQNKLNLIVANRLEFDNAEEDNNHISIAGSLGKNPEDFVLDEKDQHIMETRVGKDYQAKDLELDLNPASLAATKRIVSLAWDPEYFERELLEGYFAKLQSVLSCTEINEEKAIKMLLKKNMVQEEVIVTIKKNEKFYSTFLGPSHPPKNVKNKKNSEDRK